MNPTRKSAGTNVHGKELFDRKFVFAACLIGAVYAAIIVLVESLIGKEAAGVAAAALTALATAIFSRFEKLQFVRKSRASTVSVAVPRLSIARMLLIGLCCLGLQAILGIAIAMVAVVLHLLPTTQNLTSLAALLENWKIFAVLIAAQSLSFLASGYLASRFFKSALYGEVVIAALLALVFNNGLPLILALLQGRAAFMETIHSLPWWPPVLWLLYLSLALAGAWLGARPRTQMAAE
jgi:hypothetical protein